MCTNKRNRYSDWTFVVRKEIEAFEKLVKNEFPFQGRMYYICYQKEKEETTELIHLQGVLQLTKKTRMSALKNLLENDTIHLETAKDWSAALEYCINERDRIGDPITYGCVVSSKGKISNGKIAKKANCSVTDLMYQDKGQRILSMSSLLTESDAQHDTELEILEHMPCSAHELEIANRIAKLRRYKLNIEDSRKATENHQLYEWQQQLEDELQEHPSERRVIVYVDRKGNRGKTYFKHHFFAKYPHTAAFYEDGKSGDIKQGLSSLGYEPTVIFCDLARQVFDEEKWKKDCINYKLIESLKNGAFMSTKYKPEMVYWRKKPHFVIFTNQHLDYKKLSFDRWVVREFLDNGLIKENIPIDLINKAIQWKLTRSPAEKPVTPILNLKRKALSSPSKRPSASPQVPDNYWLRNMLQEECVESGIVSPKKLKLDTLENVCQTVGDNV